MNVSKGDSKVNQQITSNHQFTQSYNRGYHSTDRSYENQLSNEKSDKMTPLPVFDHNQVYNKYNSSNKGMWLGLFIW